MSDIEKERVIAAEVLVNAWRDVAYRSKLLADPAGILRAAGLALPDECRVTVLENAPAVWHIAIPSLEDMAASEKEQFMAELGMMIPVPAGVELHLHQSTASERFLVLPLQPQDARELSDEELKVVLGSGNGGNGGAGGNAGLIG
jgi:hypothetical protein